MKLYDFMLDPALCGAAFTGPSWEAWRIIARLWDGDAALLIPEERRIACDLTGREVLPVEAVSELYLGAGRRSGKTRFNALAGVHAAAEDYRPLLAPGEWATVSCHCANKKQARQWFDMSVGIIEASDLLKSEASNITTSVIEFAHRSRMEVFTSNFRSVRGYSMPLAIIDEAAYMRDELSAQPDIELYRALKPALATLNGRMLITSSLHRKTGLMWRKYKEHYGRPVERTA